MARAPSSDDEAAAAGDPEISKTTFLAVQQWINTPTHVRESQERALELYTLAPLLFGRSLPKSPAPSPKVLLRILKVAVPPPQKDLVCIAEAAANPGTKPEGYLTDDELRRIDFWKSACSRTLQFLSSMATEQLVAHIILWQSSLVGTMKPEYCEALAKQFLHIVSGEYPEDVCAAVSTFHHFTTHIQRVSETACFDGLFTEHNTLKDYFKECEKLVSDVHEKGNSAFKDGLFDKAIYCYTEAIRNCSFCPVLYSNRALANLRRKEPRCAVSDGFRCVNLDPTNVKGMWRFAEALFGIGNHHLAFLYNQKARQACTTEDSVGIQEQLDKFKLCIPTDLPALVESQDDSDDDTDREPKSKIIASKQTSSPVKKHKVKVPQPSVKPSPAAPFPAQNGIAYQALALSGTKDVKTPIPPPAIADSDVWIGKLQSALADGGAAFISDQYRQARSHFDVCISLVTSHMSSSPIIDGVSQQPVTVPLLRYSCGVACLRSGTMPDVTAGMEYFKLSADSLSDGQKYPLAYYGLGRALMQLGRFHMACAHLVSGLQVLSNKITLPPRLMWPGTNAVIQETCHLKSSFEDALLSCRYPPTPDAICVYDDCLSSGNHQREIYSFVCCFEGLVTVRCSHRCRMHYHIKCWQQLKSKHLERTVSKDVLGRPCTTPCCGGRLSLIRTVVRRDGEDKINEIVLAMEKSNTVKPRHPRLKLPAQSVRAIERKLERKQLRRERRMERRRRASSSDQPTQNSARVTSLEKSDGTSTASLEVNGNDLHVRMTNEAPVAVLKKGKEPTDVHEDHHKHKNPKKKVKPKTVHLDEFIGRTHTDDDTDSASIDSYPSLWLDNRWQAMYQPYQLQPVEAAGGYPDADERCSPIAADVIPGLLEFFEALLRQRGPLHVEDVVITRYLVDSFPPAALEAVSSAGGVGNFLKRYPQFGVVGDRLVLLSADGAVLPISGASSDEPMMITPFVMPGPPPRQQQRPPPLMSEEVSLVSEWLAAPHDRGWAYRRYDAAPAVGHLAPVSSYQATTSAAATSRGNLLGDSRLPTSDDTASVGTTSVGGGQPAASRSSGSSSGYASTSTSGSSVVARNRVAARHVSVGCAVGARASMLDGFDRPLGRPAVSSGVVDEAESAAATSASEEPWVARAAETRRSSSSGSLSGTPSANHSSTTSSCSSSDLLVSQQPPPPRSLPVTRHDGDSSCGSRVVDCSAMRDEIDLRPASAAEADFGSVASSVASAPGPWVESRSLGSLQSAGDAWSFSVAPSAPGPFTAHWALAPGGLPRGLTARLHPGPVGDGSASATAAAATGATRVVVPLPPSLADAAVQVDDLSAECKQLTEAVQALESKLATVKADQEQAALERERLSAALQASQTTVSRLTRELALAEECVDKARAALGEQGSGSSGNDLATGVTRLGQRLAAEESARRAADAARAEQVGLIKRLQEELNSLRRRPLLEDPSSDELQQQCLRARRAEVTVLELRYMQAVAPLCRLLDHCKQSLGRGGLLPNVANTFIGHMNRLSQCILELKNRYEEQIRLVVGGRLFSTLQDIRVNVQLGSPFEQQFLLTETTSLQAVVQPPLIPKLKIPSGASAGSASDVQQDAAAAAGQPASARRLPDAHALVDRQRHFAAAPTTASSSRTNDDRVLDLLVATYPEYSRIEHASHLRRLRAQQVQGTLTGLTLRMVVDRVGDLISNDAQAQQQRSDSLPTSIAAPAASAANKAPAAGSMLPASSRWAVTPLPEAVVRAASVEVYQEESDPCIICHDPMLPDETTRLSCRHKYHSKCIKDWFDVQHTCPLCRNFDLMPEEFPDLSSLKRV